MKSSRVKAGTRPIRKGLQAIALLAALLPGAGWSEDANRPDVDVSALPVLGGAWRGENPYRGDARVAEIGHSIFNQTCARCHGVDLANHGGAPDLSRLDRYCRRIEDKQTRQHCNADTDAYFLHSVLNGKIIVGVTHMPPWRSVLSQEEIWAIKTYIEARSAR